MLFWGTYDDRLLHGKRDVVTARIDLNTTVIKKRTFHDCVNFTSISILDSVKEIESQTFKVLFFT